MATRRPSFDIPFSIDTFKDTLKRLTIVPEKNKEGWQGQPFVKAGALASWLGQSATMGRRVTHAALLLDKVFRDPDSPLPITDDDILGGQERCPMMFCILLQMDQGHLVYHLYSHGLNDSRLPLTVNELRPVFQNACSGFMKDREIEVLVDDFHERHWQFFPLPFRRDTRPMPLLPTRILPICQRSMINDKGGTAKLHMIAVHEDFVEQDLRDAVPDSAFIDEKHGRCYQFALKSFINQSQRMFEAEIRAYKHLKDQQHVIKCFGGFNHWGDNGTSNTYSILLEYGQCDLAEYFRHVDPPALPEHVEQFWTEFFNVVSAIKDIQSFRKSRGARTENYDGWHGDIKPDNILMSERRLKLADPGFVNFVRSSDSQNRNGTMRSLNGWTSTYGPPELKESKAAVCEPWAVDMWSLGCVISEAASWIVLADSGRDAYTKMRQEAIKNLSVSAMRPPLAEDDLGFGDYFHNGHDVLPVVAQWHQTLRGMIRSSDHITGKILDLVDRHLLLTEPKKRMRATDLCLEFEKIKGSARHNRLTLATPKPIIHALRQIREQALETWVSPSQIFGGVSVEDRKAGNLTTPVILSYISRSSESTRQSRRTALNPSRVPAITIGHPQNEMSDSVFRPQNLQNAEPVLKTPPRTTTGLMSSEPTFTVFDAHYERRALEDKLRNKITGNWKRTKDQKLSSYYKDRDIIFLVDNSWSMVQYWHEVKFVLTELVAKARNQDEDGIDLHFTRSDIKVEEAKRHALEQCVRAIDSIRHHSGVQTNMAESLSRLLYAWRDKFKEFPRGTKSMTIIVLTDGQWMNSSEKDEYTVDETIINFSKIAMQLHGFQEQKRRVSIQFVSFGYDSLALARLQRLDDSLHYQGINDIVDTEPSTGDVYKMLLGSFNPEIDETITIPSVDTSPPLVQWSSSPNFSLNSPNAAVGPDVVIPRTNNHIREPREGITSHHYALPPIMSRPDSKRSSKIFEQRLFGR